MLPIFFAQKKLAILSPFKMIEFVAAVGDSKYCSADLHCFATIAYLRKTI